MLKAVNISVSLNGKSFLKAPGAHFRRPIIRLILRSRNAEGSKQAFRVFRSLSNLGVHSLFIYRDGIVSYTYAHKIRIHPGVSNLWWNNPHVSQFIYVLSTVPVFALCTFEACNRQFKWNWLTKWPRVDWIGKCYCRLICGNSAPWNANMENGRESCGWGFMQLSNIYRITLLV